MGKSALAAILYIAVELGVAAAVLTQRIERAVAEEAVEVIGIFGGVTGEVLAFLVAEKSVVLIFPIGEHIRHNEILLKIIPREAL